ncbi:hypothetical protein [Pandoraea cepalis]|uniref:hypothetical protein n=1 Tax=Pandoraea cepalis TaxID=2508294 RepID=UPI0015834069|nr:hypothetical protein [Pandoraea cepalis]
MDDSLRAFACVMLLYGNMSCFSRTLPSITEPSPTVKRLKIVAPAQIITLSSMIG